MPCLECGNPSTCNAHILPAAAGKDALKAANRKTLSLAAPTRTDDTFQSGLFDRNILCAECDGVLGRYDDHAVEMLRLLGTEAETSDRGNFVIQHRAGVRHEQLALFAGAVVWRASASQYRELAEFTLAEHEPRFRAMIFRRTRDVPTVAIARVWDDRPIQRGAILTSMSFPAKCIGHSGREWLRFHVAGLLFIVQLGPEPDKYLQTRAVTSLGRSVGAGRLTGPFASFDELLELGRVHESKYVQQMLGRI